MTAAACRPWISIVVPAYNEEDRLGATLEAIRAFMDGRYPSYEVIVVDDGSRDGTAQVVRQRQATWPQLRLVSYHPNRGKGHAVAEGVKAARGQYCLFSDADLSTPIEELAHLLPALLEEGYAIAIGSRAVPGARLERRQPWLRETMGRIFNLFVQLLATPGLWDTQCGFKAFPTAVGQELLALQRVERFAFDVEFLFLARRRGYRVKEVPVRWRDSPQSRVKVLRDAPRMLWDVLRIRWNDALGRYR